MNLNLLMDGAIKMEELGSVIAYIGLALCVIMCGMGSAIALYRTGQAGSGVLGDDPKKFSKVLDMVVLPATQGIYGFVLAIVGQSYVVDLTVAQGLSVLFACLPLTVL